MQYNSTLFDRLSKRFSSLEDKGERSSIGMKESDRFLSSFFDRFKKSERICKFPEMAAFKRLPSNQHFDPWGNSGWNMVKDLVFLEWVDDSQEEESNDAPVKKVSAWGKSSESKSAFGGRSAWLNTPYTPAKVAQKVKSGGLRAGQSRGSGKGKLPVGVSGKRQTMLPLERASMRAVAAQKYQSPINEARQSLPPMMSQSLLSQIEKQYSAGKSFKSASPMMRMMTPSVESVLSDRQISASSLASGRSGNRGLRPVVSGSEMFSDLGIPSAAKRSVAKNRKTTSVVVQKMVKESGQSLPKLVKQVIAKKSSVFASAFKGGNIEHESRVVEKTVLEILADNGLPSLVELVEQTQSVENAQKIIQEIVQKVVTVQKNTGSAASQAKTAVTPITPIVQRMVLQQVRQLDAQGLVSPDMTDTIQRFAIKNVSQALADKKIVTLEDLSQQLQSENKAIQSLQRMSENIVQSTVQGLRTNADDVQSIQKDPVFQQAMKQVLSSLPNVVQNVVQKESLFTMTDINAIVDIPRLIAQTQSQAQKSLPSQQMAKKLAFNQRTSKKALPVISAMSASIQKELRQIWPQESVSRSLTEELTEEIANIVYGEIQSGQESKDAGNLSKIVQNRLGNIVEKSAFEKILQRSDIQIGKSLLPKPSGKTMEERIVGSVVEDIIKLSQHEFSFGKAEEQQKLFSALNKVEQQLSKLRPAATPDMVDVSSISVSEKSHPEAQAMGAQNKVSPWFTREENVASTQHLQSMIEKNLNSNQRSELIQNLSAKLSPTQLSQAQHVLQRLDAKNATFNPTRPIAIAKETGVSLSQVEKVLEILGVQTSAVISQTEMKSTKTKSLFESVTQNTDRQKSQKEPFSAILDRGEAPINLPQWRGMGTELSNPQYSSKTWRLESKRRPVFPSELPEGVVLSPQAPESIEHVDNTAASSKVSPWLSHKEVSQKTPNQVGYGFAPTSISGDVNFSDKDVSQFGKGQKVSLSIQDVQKSRNATWLEPNRTVLLDNGTVIHAKTAKQLGISPTKTATAQNMPLSWTLEGVQLGSDHRTLPGWAKRASGKPQVKASLEFLVALAKSSTPDEVAQVILSNAGKDSAVLPKAAMSAIEQIRREAFKSLEQSVGQIEDQVLSSQNQAQRKSNISRRVAAMMGGLKGIKPMSTSVAEAQNVPQNDKVSQLAKQLENLVSMAENSKKEDAREEVRMAEDSQTAIQEGQNSDNPQEKDYTADIEALRQEVLMAYEQEMSLRSLRAFNDSKNTDIWW